MKIYQSKTDFKKLEYRIWAVIFFLIIYSLVTAYYAKELRPRINDHFSRTESVIMASIIDFGLILFLLYIKKVRSIVIDKEQLYIEIEFTRTFKKYNKKTAYLKALKYKVETEDGKQTVVLSDDEDFNFIIMEEEFTMEEQNEIVDYLKEIKCRTIKY